jgi:glutathione S-transferase
MLWVQLVTLAAIAQFFFFGLLVSLARTRLNVPAPATTGEPVFERYFRVQMNTLETLVVLLPSLWIAASVWSPQWAAGIGAVYLLGRQVYLRDYVRDPRRRSLGYALSAGPAMLLLLAALGAVAHGLMVGP